MPKVGNSVSLIRDFVRSSVAYIRQNPSEIVRAGVNATRLRFGVPVAALAWLASQAKGKNAPKDIEIGTVPPALRLGATVNAMGTMLRANGCVRIDEVEITPDSLRIGLRLSDLKLKVLDESETPLATLVRSGALDLSRPGNLVKFVPKKPAAIVEAENDRIVLDLMKVPKLAENPGFRRALAAIAPVLGVRAIETDGDHVWVALRATPAGLLEAIDAVRRVAT
jgi:hypothetical protein